MAAEDSVTDLVVGATAVEDTAGPGEETVGEAVGMAMAVAAMAGVGVAAGASSSGEKGGTATQNRRLGRWDREEEINFHQRL